MSLPIFLLAWMAAMLTYILVSSGLARRDNVLSVRRLTLPRGPLEEGRSPARLRLIDAVDEARGRITARLLERLRIRQSTERLLEAASLKWGAAGLLHRSVALFLAAFVAVTLLSGNKYPLPALAAG